MLLFEERRGVADDVAICMWHIFVVVTILAIIYCHNIFFGLRWSDYSHQMSFVSKNTPRVVSISPYTTFLLQSETALGIWHASRFLQPVLKKWKTNMFRLKYVYATPYSLPELSFTLRITKYHIDSVWFSYIFIFYLFHSNSVNDIYKIYIL